MTTKTGSLRYRAPELVDYDVYEYNHSVDVRLLTSGMERRTPCFPHGYRSALFSSKKVTSSNFSESKLIEKILKSDISTLLRSA